MLFAGMILQPIEPAWAVWTHDGTWIATAPGGQAGLALDSYGSNGLVAAWSQSRPDVFLRPDTNQVHVIRFDQDGHVAPGWPQAGVPVHPIYDGQFSPRVKSVPSGDLYVAWNIFPGTAMNPRGSRIKRFRPWGEPASGWPEEGLELGRNSANLHALAVDRDGNAIAAWMEFKGGKGDHDVAAQRVPPDDGASLSWGMFGVRADTTLRNDVFPAMAQDDAGGAYLVWHVFNGGEVLARRLDSTGEFSSHWPTDAVELGRNGGDLEGVSVAPDGAHGAYVVWSETERLPPSIPTGDIYLTRLVPEGGVSIAFPPGGLPVCRAPKGQFAPQVVAVDSEAVVVWADFRDSTSFDVYAHRIKQTGVAAEGWPADGMSVATGVGDQSEPTLIPDGSGGVFVAWRDQRDDAGDIYVQRLDANGAIHSGWPANGLRVCGAVGRQGTPTMASDGTGGAYVGWSDSREPSESRCYLTRVTGSGLTGPDIPSEPAPTRLRFAKAQPNPTAGSQLIEFEVPSDVLVSIEVYDIAGRKRRTLVDRQAFDAGRRGVVWDGRAEDGSRLPRGVYLARIRTDAETVAGKLVLID